MGGVYFRGGWVVDKKTTTLSKINEALLITLVLSLFLGMFFVFVVPLFMLVLVYVVLVSALTAFALLFRKRVRFEVVDEGVVFGGRRRVSWSDIEDVKAWSESHSEAEVESSPVMGYGMY